MRLFKKAYIFNYTLSNDNYKQIYDSSSLKEYYFGEFSKYLTRQVPNGRGILYRQKYDDYTCYIGHFKNGAPDGFCLRYDNGKKYASKHPHLKSKTKVT